MTRTPRWLALAAALLAVAFLIAMAFSGRMRPMQNLVAFEAAGLMSETPEQVDRVEVVADGGRRATFVRTASGGWRIRAGSGAADLAAGAAAHLETSVKFMHVTAPVRTLSRDEYEAALGEYGLDPPRYTVTLHARGRSALAARFGAKNPQALFQYVQVEGRAALYLIPVFVGQEWERVMDAITAS